MSGFNLKSPVTFQVGSEKFQTLYTIFGTLHFGTWPLVVLNSGPGLSYPYNSPSRRTSQDALPTVCPVRPARNRRLHPLVQQASGLFHASALRRRAGQPRATSPTLGDARHRVYHGAPAQRLMHLVLTDGAASYPLLRVAFADLRKQYPQDYQVGLMQFYRKHILNLEVWPEETTKSLMQMNENPTVYRATLGINEFVMTGSLKDWSVIPKLGNVSCPTLIINGADDEVQDSCVAPLFYGLKKAKWVSLGKSSHMPFWEEPEKHFGLVGNFLADSGLGNGAEVQGRAGCGHFYKGYLT